MRNVEHTKMGPGPMEEFLEELEKGHAEKTVENYGFYLERFFIQAKISRVEEITLEKVNEFRTWLGEYKNPRGGTLSPATQNYHLIALRAFLKYLAKKGIKTLALEKIELTKTGQKKISFLSGKDLERFLEAPLKPPLSPPFRGRYREGSPPFRGRIGEKGKIEQDGLIKLRDKAILELLFSSGLKVSEMAGLKRNDINLEKDEFLISQRLIPLSNQAKYWTHKYLAIRADQEPALFTRHDKAGKEATPLTPRSIERLVKKYAKIAGISKKITVQSLRHSFALEHLARGTELKEVQKLLGHKNITSTRIYTQTEVEDLKEIYQAFQSKKRKNKI